MNEIIKELLGQAGIYQPERFDKIDGGNQLEKFAELVAQKCAEAIREDLKKFPEVDLTWRSAMEQSIRVIERNFGLKK